MLQERRKSRKHHHFLLTGFSRPEKQDLQNKVQWLGGKCLEDNGFSLTATHLICKRPLRSEKFLGACATGMWILCPMYITESYKFGNWLDEQTYEWGPRHASLVKGLPDSECLLEAPRMCRELMEKTGRGQFTGWRAAVAVSNKQSHAVYKRLLELGGATLCEVSGSHDLTHLFVTEDIADTFRPLRDQGLLCLEPVYIGDFLTSSPKPSLDKYLLPRDYRPIEKQSTSSASSMVRNGSQTRRSGANTALHATASTGGPSTPLSSMSPASSACFYTVKSSTPSSVTVKKVVKMSNSQSSSTPCISSQTKITSSPLVASSSMSQTKITSSPLVASSSMSQTKITSSPLVASSSMSQTKITSSPLVTTSSMSQTKITSSPLVTTSSMSQTKITSSPLVASSPMSQTKITSSPLVASSPMSQTKIPSSKMSVGGLKLSQTPVKSPQKRSRYRRLMPKSNPKQAGALMSWLKGDSPKKHPTVTTAYPKKLATSTFYKTLNPEPGAKQGVIDLTDDHKEIFSPLKTRAKRSSEQLLNKSSRSPEDSEVKVMASIPNSVEDSKLKSKYFTTVPSASNMRRKSKNFKAHLSSNDSSEPQKNVVTIKTEPGLTDTENKPATNTSWSSSMTSKKANVIKTSKSTLKTKVNDSDSDDLYNLAFKSHDVVFVLNDDDDFEIHYSPIKTRKQRNMDTNSRRVSDTTKRSKSSKRTKVDLSKKLRQHSLKTGLFPEPLDDDDEDFTSNILQYSAERFLGRTRNISASQLSTASSPGPQERLKKSTQPLKSKSADSTPVKVARVSLCRNVVKKELAKRMLMNSSTKSCGNDVGASPSVPCGSVPHVQKVIVKIEKESPPSSQETIPGESPVVIPIRDIPCEKTAIPQLRENDQSNHVIVHSENRDHSVLTPKPTIKEWTVGNFPNSGIGANSTNLVKRGDSFNLEVSKVSMNQSYKPSCNVHILQPVGESGSEHGMDTADLTKASVSAHIQAVVESCLNIVQPVSESCSEQKMDTTDFTKVSVSAPQIVGESSLDIVQPVSESRVDIVQSVSELCSEQKMDTTDLTKASDSAPQIVGESCLEQIMDTTGSANQQCSTQTDHPAGIVPKPQIEPYSGSILVSDSVYKVFLKQKSQQKTQNVIQKETTAPTTKRKSDVMIATPDKQTAKKQKLLRMMSAFVLHHLNECHMTGERTTSQMVKQPLSGGMSQLLEIYLEERTLWPERAIKSLMSLVSTTSYPHARHLQATIQHGLLSSDDAALSHRTYRVLSCLSDIHPPHTPDQQKLYHGMLGNSAVSEHRKEWTFLKNILSACMTLTPGDTDLQQVNSQLALKFICGVLQSDFDNIMSRKTKMTVPLISQIVWPSSIRVMNTSCQELIAVFVEAVQLDFPKQLELVSLIQSLVAMTASCHLLSAGTVKQTSLTNLPDQACLFARELAYRINSDLDDIRGVEMILGSIQLPWLKFKVTQSLLDLYDDSLLPPNYGETDKNISSLRALLKHYCFLLPPVDRVTCSPHVKLSDKRALRILAELDDCFSTNWNSNTANTFIREDQHDIPVKITRLPPTILASPHQNKSMGPIQKTEIPTGPALKRRLSAATKRNCRGETALHTACMKNNVAKLKEVLQLPGVDVNVADYSGWTPLHEACNHGSIQCVQALLQYKPPRQIASYFKTDGEELKRVNLKATGADKITPLHDAVTANYTEIVRLLLLHGGPSLLQLKTSDNKTALDLAVTPEMRELLQSQDVYNPEGYSISFSQSSSQDLDCSQCCSQDMNASQRSDCRHYTPTEALYSEILRPGHLVTLTDTNKYSLLLFHTVTSYIKHYNLTELISCCDVTPEPWVHLRDLRTVRRMRKYVKLFENHLVRISGHTQAFNKLFVLKCISDGLAA